MKTCPKCQRSYPNEFALCPQDGTPLQDSGTGWEGSFIPPNAAPPHKPYGPRWVVWLALLVLAAGLGVYIAHRAHVSPREQGVKTPTRPQPIEAPKRAETSTPVPHKTKPSGQPTAKKGEPIPIQVEVVTPPKPTVDTARVQSAITQGDLFYQRGEYDSAIAAYQEGLNLDPSNQQLREKVEAAKQAKTIAILPLPGAKVFPGAGPEAQWLGVLWTKGNVSVGNANVTSGTTVLPGDVITTDQGASAWVRFRYPASMLMQGDTQVTMPGSNSGPGLVLNRGSVVVEEKVVGPVRVTVPGGLVLIKGDPQSGAECEIAAVGNASTVSVRRGLAEVYSLGGVVTLYPGQSARVEAGPQGGAQVAGTISQEIPPGVIQRQGQIQEIPLELHAAINWNDLVRTLQSGRAQITLVDGSTLNLGTRSTIKVLKHDPQAQQTEIEFTLGKVLANVQTLTAPGGRFETTTQSAVIGKIDNAYVARTDDKGTRVCGIRGTTVVKSSDPNITKTVQLRMNECTVVLFGSAPTDPVLSPSEAEGLLQATAIPAPGENPWVVGGVVAGGGAIGGGIAGIVLSSPGTTSPTTPGGP